MSIIEIIIAIIGSNVLTGLVTSWLNRRKLSADTRKANADADNVVTHTSQDLIAMMRASYEERIQRLEAQVKELQRGRESDRQDINTLNRQVGELRRSGEAQSDRIMDLESQVALWKGYAKELVSLLRSHGIQLPKWAEAIGVK